MLHDVTDDTSVSLAEVEAAFGEQVRLAFFSMPHISVYTSVSLAEVEAAFGGLLRLPYYEHASYRY